MSKLFDSVVIVVSFDDFCRCFLVLLSQVALSLAHVPYCRFGASSGTASATQTNTSTSCAAANQNKAAQLTFNPPVIQQLVACLHTQQANHFRAAVCGHVQHFACMKEDAGWGCGWRNAQMLVSHLLHISEVKGKTALK